MKILRRLFKKEKRPRSRRLAEPERKSEAPKNGPLVLAVIASIAATVLLAALNVKYMSAPQGSGGTGTLSTDVSKTVCAQVPSAVSGQSAEEAKPDSPPQLSFYNTLTRPQEADTPHESEESESKSGSCPTETGGDGKSAGKKSPAVAESRQDDEKESPSLARLPGRSGGKKRYTVQVGTFTHPALAKRWAAQWKAKGFTVFLRPVARPGTGVVYRLYLGVFSSRRKADELVKRLKKKEGISAFRVAVRK